MNNTLPPEIEALCVQEVNGRKVPLWPYIVAVTGHRTFAKPGEVDGLQGYERETIKKAFRHELEQMARLWRTSCGNANAPFILLSGMAEGADQLAAEAALEIPKELNVKVAAILPMEKDLFRLTIKDETAQERFDSLLKQVHLAYSLPLPDNSDKYRAQVADVDNPDTEDLRQAQYEMLGKFLALHSHVLFALWDGIDMPNLRGGTSTVLHFKLEGNTENQTQSDILTYTSVGPVVQFLLPRGNEENLKEKDSVEYLRETPEEIAVFYWSKHDLWDDQKKCYFFPTRKQMTKENRCQTSVSGMSEIANTLERIGELNRQSMKHSRKIQKKLSGSKGVLFGKYLSNAEDFCDAETEALVHHYTCVDVLAERFKQGMNHIVFWYLWVFGLFLGSSALLSSFWEIRQNGWGTSTFFSFVHRGQHTCCDMLFSMPCLTSVYWLSIVLFVSVYWLARIRKNRVRFYLFRAVAEALRVQIYWRIAEMSDCVSGYYRSHQLPETEWLRSAINGLDVLLAPPEEKNFKKTRLERLTFVRDVWINGQLSYFQMNLGKADNTNSHPILKSVGVCIWLILISALPFIFTWLESLHANSPLSAELGQVLYSMSLALIPIYGLRLFWKRFKKPQSDLARYKQMLFPFDRAILLMKSELEALETKHEPQAAEESLETPKPVEPELETEESEAEEKDRIKKLHVILRQLGTEAVSENAAWYLSMGERKLTLQR